MGRMAARMGETSYPIVSTYPPRPQKSTCAALRHAHSRQSRPTLALGQGIVKVSFMLNHMHFLTKSCIHGPRPRAATRQHRIGCMTVGSRRNYSWDGITWWMVAAMSSNAHDNRHR